MSEKHLETQLIIEAKSGDSSAFGKLINPYRKNLFTYLLRFCRERMTAEDLLQETLIKTWRGLKNYNEKQKFSSWLFVIAHNVSIDSIRARKVREATTFFNDGFEAVSESNPHSELLKTELKITLEKEVESLPNNQKQVFLLRQHSDMTFKEIATVMNQSLNTVLSHMNYAVKKLKSALREENEE